MLDRSPINRRELLAAGVTLSSVGLAGCSGGSSTLTPVDVDPSDVRISDIYPVEDSGKSSAEEMVSEILVEASKKSYFGEYDENMQGKVRAVSEASFDRFTEDFGRAASFLGQSVHNLDLICEKELELGESVYVTGGVVVDGSPSASTTAVFETFDGGLGTGLATPELDTVWRSDAASTAFFSEDSVLRFSYESRGATQKYMSEVAGDSGLGTPIRDMTFTMTPPDILGSFDSLVPTDEAYQYLSNRYYNPSDFVEVLSEKDSFLRDVSESELVFGVDGSGGFSVEGSGRDAVISAAESTFGVQ